MKINDIVLPEFGQLADIPGIEEQAVLSYVLEPYTEIEAKRHINRVRELVSFPNKSAVNGHSSYPSIDTGKTTFLEIEDLDVEKDNQPYVIKQAPLTTKNFTEAYGPEELLPKSIPERAKAVHSLHFSQWNPAPAHLKTKGHICYLVAGTLEGEIHHIVCHSAGFYISNSTAHWFDPTPKVINGDVISEHSLFNLLSKVSPKLMKTLEANREQIQDIPPQVYASPTNCFLYSPWIVNEPTNNADFGRTQKELVDNVDSSVSRDWNDEFQAARNMSKDNIADRILRERLLSKISFEFAQAAVHGAMSIIEGSIQSLNPFETPDARIYLQDNIFYSFATDPSKVFEEFGGKAAAHYAAAKDIQNINFTNKIDPEGITTVLTTVVDYAGRRITAQAPVPGIFRSDPEENNQVHYGTIESLQSIKTDESYAEVLKAIASDFHLKEHTFFDIEGRPAKLVTPVSVNGVSGTDNRKYVLDLQRLTPLDLGFLDAVSKDTETPYPHGIPLLRRETVDGWFKSKSSAQYQEQFEKRKAEKEAQDAAEGKVKKEPKKPKEKTEETEETEGAEEKADGEAAVEEEEEEEEITIDTIFSLDEQREMIAEANARFQVNPDVPFDLSKIPADYKEEYEKDAEVIREISSFITETIIPTYINDVKAATANTPIDGQQLTEIFHKRGINMRYLGAVANAASDGGPLLETFKGICVSEVITRSAKHVLNSILAQYPKESFAYIVSQFFNSLLGFKLNDSPKLEITNGFKTLYNQYDFSDLESSITVESIRSAIAHEAKSRFRLDLESDWALTMNLRYIFRNLSLQLGLQWRARKYDFTATEPYYDITDKLDAPYGIHTELAETRTTTSTAGKKKKGKKGSNTSSNSVLAATQPITQKLPTLFSHNDVLNIVPKVRHSTCKSQLAEEALETGRISLLRDDKKNGLILMTESAALHEQIYGNVHKEVAHAFSQLSLVYHELKEHELAVNFGRKAAIIQDRCSGYDSAEAIVAYLNLALFEYGNQNAAGAINLIKHAMKRWVSITGHTHPDSFTTINNSASMLQGLGHFDMARELVEGTLPLSQQFFGDESVLVASHHFQIANFALVKSEFAEALEHLKIAHAVYQKQFGDENTSTIESKKWIDAVTELIEKSAAGAQVLPAAGNKEGNAIKNIIANTTNANQRRNNNNKSAKTNGVPISHDDIKERVQARIRAGHTAASSSDVAKAQADQKSIDDLVAYIEGTEAKSISKKSTKGSKKGKK